MRTRHAFTMVELLVVISIIVLLMGILIPSIGYMQGRADITKTQARLTAIAGAIGSYQGDTGRYPLQDVDTLPTHLTNLLGSNPAITDLYQKGSVEEPEYRIPIADALATRLASIDPGSFGESGSMVMPAEFVGRNYLVLADAWNQPLWYQPWTAYLDINDAVNPDSFQLWSFGPDGLNNVVIEENNTDRHVGVRYDDPIPYGDDVVAWQ